MGKTGETSLQSSVRSPQETGETSLRSSVLSPQKTGDEGRETRKKRAEERLRAAERKVRNKYRRESYQRHREEEIRKVSAYMKIPRGDAVLGAALREWRKSEGLTQTALGKIMGKTQAQVSRMERGMDPLPERWLKMIPEEWRS